jgi:hypothetical protein
MSLGRRIVRQDQILIQYMLFGLVIDWVADDQSIVQSERREPFVRGIAPSLQAVTGAEELRGLFWSDGPLFNLLGLGLLVLLIALGDAGTGGRGLRRMARGRRGPRGRRWTLWSMCHGVPRLLAGEDFAHRLGDSSRDPLDLHRERLAAKLEMHRSASLSDDFDAILRHKMVVDEIPPRGEPFVHWRRRRRLSRLLFVNHDAPSSPVRQA